MASGEITTKEIVLGIMAGGRINNSLMKLLRISNTNSAGVLYFISRIPVEIETI
jgi:hypothetical protein